MTQIAVQYRKGSLTDVDAIVQILSTSRLEYLSYAKSPHTTVQVRQWVHEILIPTGNVLIAALDGEDVGVLATSVSEGIGWIEQLYLAPGYVGQGIGTELLSCALNSLPRPIRLWTFQQNDRAIRFYERHGFEAIKYTDGENNEEKCPDLLFEYTVK